MSLVKDGLAKAWAEDLTARSGFAFFPHRHDGETAPPFGVVVVKSLAPTITADDVHLAEVRIVVVSDTSDGAAADARERAGLAYHAIRETPKFGEDRANGVRLCGFELESIEEAAGSGEDGRMVYSDVFMLSAGVMGI